jgi:hypothetical protein
MKIFDRIFKSKDKPDIPDIGRDIEWTDVIRQVFRVLDFDRNKTVIREDGKVVIRSIFKPYGYLLVESPVLNQQARLPIMHRDDFLLAASVYDNPFLVEDIKKKDLLVTYIPRQELPGGFAAGVTHTLHYIITSKNVIDKYYEEGKDARIAKPEPEKLFYNIAWEGAIRVGINLDPEL